MAPPIPLEQFLEFSPSKSTPFLLDLARRQASKRGTRDLLAQHQRDLFVAASPLDQRMIHRLDGVALEAAHEFEAVQLSPVAPLGTCSVVAPTSQNRTLTTTRGSEVVSDPTNVLALESARRLLIDPHTSLRFCTAHQVLRAQPFPPQPGFTRHFRMWAMTEAGASLADEQFEVEAVLRHLLIFNRMFDAFTEKLGCHFPRRRAVVRTSVARSSLRDRLLPKLVMALPNVELVQEPFESKYYDGLRIMFGPHTESGAFCAISDLGLFDWVARLTANRRFRFVASGFGLQLIPLLFSSGTRD